jgi:hypothetical protein
MQGTHFTVSYHTAGNLAANHVFYFIAPFACQLVAVSASGSNTNNGILDIGPSTDTDGYLDAWNIGDGNVPLEADQNDFVGGEFAHIAKGTIVAACLDYDGAGGTATADYTLVMTFSEG